MIDENVGANSVEIDSVMRHKLQIGLVVFERPRHQLVEIVDRQVGGGVLVGLVTLVIVVGGDSFSGGEAFGFWREFLHPPTRFQRLPNVAMAAIKSEDFPIFHCLKGFLFNRKVFVGFISLD